MNDRVEEELVSVARGWDRAMVENDAEAIGRFMSDDWMIIGSDGSVGDKATFLGLVKSGTLRKKLIASTINTFSIHSEMGTVTADKVPSRMGTTVPSPTD